MASSSFLFSSRTWAAKQILQKTFFLVILSSAKAAGTLGVTEVLGCSRKNSCPRGPGAGVVFGRQCRRWDCWIDDKKLLFIKSEDIFVHLYVAQAAQSVFYRSEKFDVTLLMCYLISEMYTPTANLQQVSDLSKDSTCALEPGIYSISSSAEHLKLFRRCHCYVKGTCY